RSDEFLFFFFSSGRRHTRFSRDWSSDVCSSDLLRSKGWRQEALLRLLENVLAVGEDPDNLVVYAALGKAARNWAAHRQIVEALRSEERRVGMVGELGGGRTIQRY